MPALQNIQVPYVLAFRDFFFRRLTAPVPEGNFICRERGSGREIVLRLQKCLGTGMVGSVHRVDPDSPGLRVLGLEGRLVVKIPHAVRGFRVPYFFCNYGQDTEALQLERVAAQTGAVENSSRYPREAGWKRGQLPFAPIVSCLRTDRGVLLLKPELLGLSVGEIRKNFGPQLPSEYLRGLRDIYELAQAVIEKTRVPGAHPLLTFGKASLKDGRPFLIDINATNLIWVNHPQQLESLGMDKPGFVFCELSELPSARYQESHLPFALYLEEFAIASEYEAKKL